MLLFDVEQIVSEGKMLGKSPCKLTILKHRFRLVNLLQILGQILEYSR